MRGRWRAGALGVMIGAAASGPVLPLVAALAAPVVLASEAWARSSGGYSRPGASSGRTPSFGGRVAPRTPSFGSGGYSRPGGYDRRPSFAPSPLGQSRGDRSFSREQSGGALQQFRAQQDALRRQQEIARQPRPVPQPAPNYAPAPGYGGYGGSGSGFGGFAGGLAGGLLGGGMRNARPGWYGNQGWAPPAYALGGQRSFGLWDGLFLWFLLDNLSRAGSTDWFRAHRDDPGVQQWRAQAEQQAQTNEELRRKLDELDRRLAEQQQQQGPPKDPGYLPPDTPAAVATAPEPDRRTPSVASDPAEAASAGRAASRGLGGMLVVPVLLVGGGGLAYLAFRRRKSTNGEDRGGTMVGGNLGSAANMLAHKLSGESYTPQHFRVGMTVQVDPTPFILAAGAIKLPQPEGGTTSVAGVGRVEGEALLRLYLPDGRSLFQVHLGVDGKPDECRLFSTIDEVTPADTQEWAAWLDPREGMIGWPEFQTKDGKVYARVWAPGAARVEPRRLAETVEEAVGTRRLTSLAMLYGAPTGLDAPAPGTEYVLVSAVEEGSRAWVEIRAGIDVNPATLQIA